MSANEKQDAEIRIYLVGQTAMPRLRELAAIAPVVPGERGRVDEIRSHFRTAPAQFRGRGEHLATGMAFLDDNELLTETEGDLRTNLELHVGGRVTIYAPTAEQRAHAAPDRIDASALQRYWEEEQFQSTDAGADIHGALAVLHANLVAAGDDAAVLVHW